MFLIILTYTKPLEVLDTYLAEHRSFLDDCYKNNLFVVSGPQIPRTGGVIISQLNDREKLDNVLKQDPFCIYDVATYEVIEFNPIKYHTNFSSFIE